MCTLVKNHKNGQMVSNFVHKHVLSQLAITHPAGKLLESRDRPTDTQFPPELCFSEGTFAELRMCIAMCK